MLPVPHGLTQFGSRRDSERAGGEREVGGHIKKVWVRQKRVHALSGRNMGPALFRPVKARTDVAKGVAERGRYSVFGGDQLHLESRYRAIIYGALSLSVSA